MPRAREDLPRWHQRPTAPVRPEPVFVDRSGRRRRVAVLAGVGTATGLVAALVVLVVAIFTGGSTTVPAWPDADGGPKPTGRPQVVRQGNAPTAPAAPTTPTAVRTPSRAPAAPAASATLAPGRVRTEQPGQGDERRAAKRARPSRAPGRSG